MEKRGQGIQFNWIFVIVSGAIILSFFVMFTFNYIQLQNTKQNVYASRSFVNVLTYMESSYTGKGLVIDSTSENAFRLNFYTNLDISCEGERSTVIVGNEPLSEQVLQDEIVFAPKTMRVNAMSTWINPWYNPFFISNFIYLVKPDKNIYIKYDGATQDFVDRLQINTWTEFNVKKVQSVSEIKPDDDVSVLWISSSAPDTNLLKKVKDNSSYFSLIHIIPDVNSENYLHGRIIFYNGTEKKEDRFYGEPAMYAALFSGGYNEYKCGMTRAMNRLKKSSDSLMWKIDLLYRISQPEECKLIYSSLRGMLKDFSMGKNLENADILMNENSKLIAKGCVTVF